MRRLSPIVLGARTGKVGFNPNVHGARGLFASAVFLFHVVNSGLATYPILAAPISNFLLTTSEFGVELFFCISGFVIAGTLRRAADPHTFLEDRMIRIFPVLWVTSTIIATLCLITHTHGFETWTFGGLLLWLPANLLALPGIFDVPLYHPAAWSLSYEMAFYAACAVGWWSVSRAGRNVLWVAVPAAAVALAFYPRALLFVPGILVAEGILNSPRTAWLTRHPIPMLVIFLLAWRGIQQLSQTHIILTTLFQWSRDLRLPLAVLGIVAATFGFAGLVSGVGMLGRFLRKPVLQYLGTISYSFYLWHPIVMACIKYEMLRSGLAAAAGPNAQLLFLVLALPPALVVSHISQRVLEHDIGLWLRRRLHHPAPLATPAAALPTIPSISADPTGSADALAREVGRGAAQVEP